MVDGGVCMHIDCVLQDRGRVLPPLLTKAVLLPLVKTFMEGDFGVTKPSTEELSIVAMATSVADERDGATMIDASGS